MLPKIEFTRDGGEDSLRNRDLRPSDLHIRCSRTSSNGATAVGGADRGQRFRQGSESDRKLDGLPLLQLPQGRPSQCPGHRTIRRDVGGNELQVGTGENIADGNIVKARGPGIAHLDLEHHLGADRRDAIRRLNLRVTQQDCRRNDRVIDHGHCRGTVRCIDRIHIRRRHLLSAEECSRRIAVGKNARVGRRFREQAGFIEPIGCRDASDDKSLATTVKIRDLNTDRLLNIKRRPTYAGSRRENGLARIPAVASQELELGSPCVLDGVLQSFFGQKNDLIVALRVR